MAMLSVRFLDGSTSFVEVGADATVARVCAELEQGLPDFHEVKLIHNTEELVVWAPVVIEVQAVKIASPSKIVKYIRAYVDKLSSDESVSDSEHQRCLSAIDLLGKQKEIPPDFCNSLLHELHRLGEIRLDRLNQIDFNPEDWRSALRILPDSELAAAFGRVCGDPAPYVEKLLTKLGPWLLARVVAAIVTHQGPAALEAHAKVIAARSVLVVLNDDRSMSPEACCVLAYYGRVKHILEMQQLLIISGSEENAEFAAAVERMRGHGQVFQRWRAIVLAALWTVFRHG
jgi:hypothetical protein